MSSVTEAADVIQMFPPCPQCDARIHGDESAAPVGVLLLQRRGGGRRHHRYGSQYGHGKPGKIKEF